MIILLAALLVTVSDQVTKQIIRYNFAEGETLPVIDGFFNLTFVRNSGAAWGMFQEYSWALIALSIFMLCLMIVFRHSFISESWYQRLALGLMIGGILGNLIDRVKLGAVTDFLDFYVGSYHWPSFNIADSAICIGVGIYVLSATWSEDHPLHETKPSSAKAGDLDEALAEPES